MEDHCYITDASITTFRNEFFNNLVVFEARMFKIIVCFAAENMGKKECYQVWTGQIITLHGGVCRKANI